MTAYYWWSVIDFKLQINKNENGYLFTSLSYATWIHISNKFKKNVLITFINRKAHFYIV